MIQEAEVTQLYGVTNLIDALLNFKMDSKEFISNQNVVEKIGTAIDKLDKSISGHILLSITKDKIRDLLLITKQHSCFTMYKWKLTETIEKIVNVEIHEASTTDDVTKFIDEHQEHSIHKAELASALVNESLNGYCINKSAAKQLLNIKNKNEISQLVSKELAIAQVPELEELIPFGRKILTKIDRIKSDTKKTINEILSKNEIKLDMEHDFSTYSAGKIFVGEMTSIKEIGGRRHAEVKWVTLSKFSDQLKYGRVTFSTSPAVGSANIDTYKDIYMYSKRDYSSANPDFNPLYLDDAPYNLLDEKRIIVALQENYHDWKIIIGPDSRVIKDSKETLDKDLTSFLTEGIEKGHTINNANLEIPSVKATVYYGSYENSQKKANPELDGLRLKLKSLKVMIDEYNYLVKKNSSLGQDITITENIKYNHEEGKISYNDFSLAVNDELIKSKLYELFNSYLMKYYRSEATEQDILDELIGDIFDVIKERLNSGSKITLDLPFKINNNININVSSKISTRYKKQEDLTKEKEVSSTGQLFYINDQRFNKNEVLMVLREMTCYRDQAEADNFISNIGRLGLSSYIGISTGYEVRFSSDDTKLFRFKKLKGGRSNFELLLDDTSIPIRGKKLINILYSKFIGDHVPSFFDKIPALIYELSGSSLQYLKYKVLIDATYKAFKDKSREYLNKKVEELKGEHVKYYNKKAHKIIDGVLIKGLSGKTYVIAYDSRDSYVFMDPEMHKEEEEEYYQEGKYICMIDQSNIKSNISYDTIVSKLMALKNDSSIAHTIYNLQEEL